MLVFSRGFLAIRSRHEQHTTLNQHSAWIPVHTQLTGGRLERQNNGEAVMMRNNVLRSMCGSVAGRCLVVAFVASFLSGLRAEPPTLHSRSPDQPPHDTVIACALGNAGLASLAAEEGYVTLGQPCRAKQVLGGTVVRDRDTGRELLALTNMNEVTGCELILIDVDNGRGEVVRAPAGAGSWNVREVSGDRLVIGTFYDGTFLIFDLKTKRFVHHVRFAKEEYLWNTTLGSDGRLYAGTYPGGRLGAPRPPDLCG